MASATLASAGRPGTARPGPEVVGHVTHLDRAMGGRLGIHVAARSGRADDALADARRAASRVRAWAGILSRHDEASALSRLNADPRPAVTVGPTLGAALAWAEDAGRLAGGVVDVTRLDDRLRVEGIAAPAAPADRRWRVVAGPGRACVVERAPGLRLDLDGVGKGWLADRALRLLAGHPGAVVDADGDVAIHVAPGDRWEIGVADPRDDGALLAIVVLADEPGAAAAARRRWGVATSGTSVHRFGPGAHHLIDPRTGRAAVTDVVQATVIASGAAVAETLAKTAVILGAAVGLDALDRAGAAGAILLLDDGRVLALPQTGRFLA